MQETGAVVLLVFKSWAKNLPNTNSKDKAEMNLPERSLLRRLIQKTPKAL